MTSEQLVDVTYRGLDVGRGLRLSQVGPGSAHLACDAPLPVGTALVLAVADGIRIPARVLRVHESADALPVGMRIGVVALEDEAKSWWDRMVTADDLVIPEPARTRAAEGEPEAQVLADEPATATEEAVEAQRGKAAADATEEAVEAQSGEPAAVEATEEVVEEAAGGDEGAVSGETDAAAEGTAGEDEAAAGSEAGEAVQAAAEEIPADDGNPEGATETAAGDEMHAAGAPPEADPEADAPNKAKGKKRRRRSRNRR